MIILEKYTGFRTSPVLKCLAQYFLSKKTPLRIDLMSAIFTETQCAGLVTSVVWLCEVSTTVCYAEKDKSGTVLQAKRYSQGL